MASRQELFVTIIRKVPKPMPAARVAALIEDLSQWTLHESVRADVLAAIELHRLKRVSLWDALILCRARAPAPLRQDLVGRPQRRASIRIDTRPQSVRVMPAR